MQWNLFQRDDEVYLFELNVPNKWEKHWHLTSFVLTLGRRRLINL